MTIGRFSKDTLYGLLALVVILGLIRLALPYGVEYYINDRLDQAEGYDGHVGDVDLMLFRGAYEIEDIRLVKTNGLVEEPLFSAPKVTFSILWSALWKGSVVGEVDVYEPRINFVDNDDPNATQVGESENWLDLANDLFPLKIDRLQIHTGTIAFQNPSADPAINIELHDIQLEARNLVNSRDLNEDLSAKIQGAGELTSQGNVTFSATMDPSTKNPTFDLNLEMHSVALKPYENVLNHYAPFDLEAGTLDLAMELASDNGKVEGYAKPVLHHVDVFSWKGDIQEDEDGFWGGLVELLSGAVAEIFENQRLDQLATDVPIEGSLDNPDIDPWVALGGVLRNAFVEAIRARLEHSIQLNREAEPQAS